MLIQGWNFDFESLPYWDNHDKIPYVTDDLFQNEISNVACIIYSIAEVRMCHSIGFLAILRNKENPELLLNITNFCFPKQEITFSSDGNIVFLQAQIYFRENHSVEYPLLLINIKNPGFSYIRTHHNPSCFRIKERDTLAFTVEADDFQVKIENLNWYELKELNHLPAILYDPTI